MAAPTIPTIDILDCSRGLSDLYPARLADDQVAAAWDVEFWDGQVCGRRNGSAAVVTGGTPGQAQESLFVHTPTTSASDNRLARATGATPGAVVLYDAAYSPTTPSITPADAFVFSQGVGWASIGGFLFIAAKSAVDRLHVYDGTVIRRTGLAAPAAPNVANTGAGSFADARQYRVRYTAQVGGVTVRRSEPSPATAFTPSGTGAAARITKPAAVNEGETHWEVEEIAPSGDWYRIATVVVATTTYDDTLALSAVASTGVLSADVGDYALEYSARWLAVDEDRLLLGGAHDQAALSARVSWTPLGSAVGAGNYERLPADVEGFLDFDTLDGGGLTGLVGWEGKVIVFKRGQVHQMVRSSSRLRAYLPDNLSRRHGALPNSIIEGTDVDGLSCLYFLDPEVGPMQLGFRGLRVLAPDLQRTWKEEVNFAATQVACVGFHPEKQQVWWHVAIGAATKPSRRWMYSVESNGVVYHTIPHPVRSVAVWNGKPHMLLDNPDGVVLVQGDDPAETTDYGDVEYRAYIRTRAYQKGGLMRRFGVVSGVVEARAATGVSVSITPVKDYGVESRTITVDLTPASAEEFVTKPVDNLYLTDAMSLQFEIGDAAARDSAPWQVHGVTMAVELGAPTTGRG